MIKHYCVLFFIVFNIGTIMYCMDQPAFGQGISSMKKKILILTSIEGGNKIAGEAIEAYLKDAYIIQQSPVFKEILAPLDPLNFFTSQKYSGEQFYNAFVPGKHFDVLRWIYGFGKWYIQSQKEKICVLLRDYFIKNNPDLIISVIPVINNMVLEVAQELAIPFLLMPTDLDITPYILNITNPTYKQFYMGLIFDDPEIMKPAQGHIDSHYITTIGAPIKSAFLMQKNKSDVRYHYGIDENKMVIMILMGSQGCDEIELYVAELLKVKEPFHLLVCIGKNERCRINLSQLTIPPHISLSIIGFSPNIADYMTIADLFITKSGTLSVCEALYKNLPLFLDATSTLLPWEEFNHHFIKKNEFGISIKNYSEVVPAVTNALVNKDTLLKYKNNIQNLEKKDFSHEFKKLIEKIFRSRDYLEKNKNIAKE